jgi:pantoate--beta-alanine ligase
MQRETTIAGVRAAVAAARATAGGAREVRIGFVPTMGALHEGHLALVRAAREVSSFVVMSVFVNPTQFGPGEDLSRYPRDIEGDAAKAAGAGVDLLFAPTAEEIYPEPPLLRIDAGDPGSRWEGATRPGHFDGVLLVVAKLFQIVAPDVAVFGRKDFQQSVLVRHLVRELCFPVEIVVAPTVRESDGLALSSRNAFLAADDRQRALSLSRALRAASDRFARGERSGDALEAAGRTVLEATAGVVTDYFAVVDPHTLLRAKQATAESVALVAARVGGTRLIDNANVGERP